MQITKKVTPSEVVYDFETFDYYFSYYFTVESYVISI